MARKSLQPELNRSAPGSGRDAQTPGSPTSSRSRSSRSRASSASRALSPDEETEGAAAAADFDDEIDLRAEDDALIAAELDAAEAERAEDDETGRRGRGRGEAPAPDPSSRRRGGRRSPQGAGRTLEATFDHGEEGYGLWLDPAVQDDPIYAEYWAGHRPVEVTIEEDQIVIRRAGRRQRRGRRRASRRGRGQALGVEPRRRDRPLVARLARVARERGACYDRGDVPRRRRCRGRPGSRVEKHQSVPCSM